MNAEPAATAESAASALKAVRAPQRVYSFRDMHLRVGDRAQLEPPAQTGVGRVAVRIVGWVESECLIVSAPRTAAGRLLLETGELVLLRAFTGRQAFAFRCAALKRSAPPFEYLHLSFPERIEGLDVRNSPRCKVNLPGKARPAGAGAPVELSIDNVSATGALLVAPEPLGTADEKIKLEFAFTLHEVPVSLSLDCVIRSGNTGQDASGAPYHRHGVLFDDIAPNDRLALAALVWFHMCENPLLAA